MVKIFHSSVILYYCHIDEDRKIVYSRTHFQIVKLQYTIFYVLYRALTTIYEQKQYRFMNTKFQSTATIIIIFLYEWVRFYTLNLRLWKICVFNIKIIIITIMKTRDMSLTLSVFTYYIFFFFTTISQGLEFKGQMVLCNESGSLLYVGSPLLDGLDSLTSRSLFISDIPLHDATRDVILIGEQARAQVWNTLYSYKPGVS